MRAPPQTDPVPLLSHSRVVPNHLPSTPCHPQRATPTIPSHPSLPLEARRRPRELMPQSPIRPASEAVHGAVWPRSRPETRKRSSGGEATSAMSYSSGCSRLATIMPISRREKMSRPWMHIIRRLLSTSLVGSLSIWGIRMLGFRASRGVSNLHGEASRNVISAERHQGAGAKWIETLEGAFVLLLSLLTPLFACVPTELWLDFSSMLSCSSCIVLQFSCAWIFCCVPITFVLRTQPSF